MILRAKWAAAYEAVKERRERDQENVDPDKRDILFELVCKGLYPPDIRMKDDADKCSECRDPWWSFEPAFGHANGLPHFVNWCIEHPGEVRTRFPEAVLVLAETTLRAAPAVTR